jgi:hypothetical protein
LVGDEPATKVINFPRCTTYDHPDVAPSGRSTATVGWASRTCSHFLLGLATRWDAIDCMEFRDWTRGGVDQHDGCHHGHIKLLAAFLGCRLIDQLPTTCVWRASGCPVRIRYFSLCGMGSHSPRGSTILRGATQLRAPLVKDPALGFQHSGIPCVLVPTKHRACWAMADALRTWM